MTGEWNTNHPRCGWIAKLGANGQSSLTDFDAAQVVQQAEGCVGLAEEKGIVPDGTSELPYALRASCLGMCAFTEYRNGIDGAAAAA